jgi:hypothetical protein
MHILVQAQSIRLEIHTNDRLRYAASRFCLWSTPPVLRRHDEQHPINAIYCQYVVLCAVWQMPFVMVEQKRQVFPTLVSVSEMHPRSRYAHSSRLHATAEYDVPIYSRMSFHFPRRHNAHKPRDQHRPIQSYSSCDDGGDVPSLVVSMIAAYLPSADDCADAIRCCCVALRDVA